MTNDPVPPIPQQGSKGLSPWAWLAIGCAGILVLSGVGLTVAGYFIYGKAKEVAREIGDDPVAVAAQLIAAANPEIELVEADKNDRVVMFRNTESGEEFTFDYDAIEEGRFSFTSGDETTSVELESDREGGGGMTLTTGDGHTMTYGDGASESPDWVPIYPGTESQGVYASDTAEMWAGAFSFETDDDLDQVLNFYVSELETNGFVIQNRTTTPTGALLVAKTPDEARTTTITASVDGEGVGAIVNFSEKK